MKLTTTLVQLALVSASLAGAMPSRFSAKYHHRRDWSPAAALDNWNDAVGHALDSYKDAVNSHSQQGSNAQVRVNNNNNNNNGNGGSNNNSNGSSNNNNNNNNNNGGSGNGNGSGSSGTKSSGSSSSSSPSSSSSSNSSNTNGTAKKVGLAWAVKNSMNIDEFKLDKVSWYYSWSATPGWNNAPTDIAFCPMLWGNKDTSSFEKNVINKPNGKYNRAKCVLGINEPDQDGQANMDVSTGCSLMRKYVAPLKEKGWYLVSPATSSAPAGMKWMKDFRSQCSDVWDKIDAVAVHYYDISTKKFKNYVEKWHDEFNKPIWVTEYACQDFNGNNQCSEGEAKRFHTEMAKWFNEQSYIQAYAPFGLMMNMQGVQGTNRLTNGDGPNDLFRAIAN